MPLLWVSANKVFDGRTVMGLYKDMFKNEHFSVNSEHTFSIIPLVLRVNLQAFGIVVKSIPANTRHCQIAFLVPVNSNGFLMPQFDKIAVLLYCLS